MKMPPLPESTLPGGLGPDSRGYLTVFCPRGLPRIIERMKAGLLTGKIDDYLGEIFQPDEVYSVRDLQNPRLRIPCRKCGELHALTSFKAVTETLEVLLSVHRSYAILFAFSPIPQRPDFPPEALLPRRDVTKPPGPELRVVESVEEDPG